MHLQLLHKRIHNIIVILIITNNNISYNISLIQSILLHYTWKIFHETIKVILKFDLLKISNKDFVWHSNRSFRYLPESIDSEFRRMMASRSGQNVNSPCDINEDSFAHVRCSGTRHKGSSRFILGRTEREVRLRITQEASGITQYARGNRVLLQPQRVHACCQSPTSNALEWCS